MTPKDYALRFIREFALLGMETSQTGYETFDKELAKKCALIAIDSLIGDFKDFPFREYSWEDFNSKLDNIHQHKDAPIGISKYSNEHRKFWQSVKTEIENL